MEDSAFRLPMLFDYAATLAWATSGAVVGIRKGYDIVGVFVIALLSAVGGGLVRDGILLHRTPVFLINPHYLPLIAATTVLISVFTGPLTSLLKANTIRTLVEILDALGTPAFAAVGMQLAQDKGISTAGVIFVGIANGVSGGLLRDLMVGDVPVLLRPGQFVTLTLVFACGLFLFLRRHYQVGPTDAAWAMVATFFLIRVISVRFKWKSRAVAELRAPAGQAGDEPR
jgi:uncharacterized membrane protein YeiH